MTLFQHFLLQEKLNTSPSSYSSLEFVVNSTICHVTTWLLLPTLKWRQ